MMIDSHDRDDGEFGSLSKLDDLLKPVEPRLPDPIHTRTPHRFAETLGPQNYEEFYQKWTPDDSSSEKTLNSDGRCADFRNKPPKPIAICGIGLRLPGGIRDAGSFWEILENGRDTRAPVPLDKLNRKGTKDYSKCGYFLDEELFDLDTSFFSMSKKELELMDPQQRKLLEVVRECFENAGEVKYRGRAIGVFVGTFGDDWMQIVTKDDQRGGSYALCGYSDLLLANRVSYEYDLRGPSIVTKTGCSASLTALHEACRALRNGECEAAVVAGANMIMTSAMTSALEGVLSPEVSSKTFDAAADGYARGEAVNAIYLKRLDGALRDGNPVRAIIRNTGINSDGRSNGIMVPNGLAHEALMRKVYSECGLDPRHTAFVECHGTGTQAGDPIEAMAVGNVFGEHGILIGSVKPNVGHSEGASGITSVLKAILALEHECIPPNIKFSTPNPRIPFQQKGLVVPVQPTPLPPGRAKRISVSSYGVGGSNAHVILDSIDELRLQAYADTKESKKMDPTLLVFSANTQESLRHLIGCYRDYLERYPERLHDVAYNLASRRERLPYRAYSLAYSSSTLPATPAARKARDVSSLIMIFNGQGAQWPGMGKELLQHDERFRQDIMTMDGILHSLSDPPRWTIMFELQKPADTSQVHLAEFSQPLCTAVQIALFNAYRRAGVLPNAVIGHSSGEIAAAYAAGGLSMRQAITIAYFRGRVCREGTRKGGMAAVSMKKDDLAPFLSAGLTIACENSSANYTVSGGVDELRAMIDSIHKCQPDVFVRQLKVDMAYHSRYMDAIASGYEDLIFRELGPMLLPGSLGVPLFSSVTAKRVECSSQFGPRYWSSNLTSPVLFHSACSRALLFQPNSVLLEIGPHSTLSGALRQICDEDKQPYAYIPTMQRHCSSYATILAAFGELYYHGVDVNLEEVVAPGKTLTDLPAYPWEHSSIVLPENRMHDVQTSVNLPHPLLGRRVYETTAFEPSWRNYIKLDELPWIGHHKLQDDVVFPLACYIMMAGEAIQQLSGCQTSYALRHIIAHTALVLGPSRPTEIITSLTRHRLTDAAESDWYDFTISSYSGSTWVQHCHGQVKLGAAIGAAGQGCDLRSPRKITTPFWYNSAKEIGLDYGPSFQGLSGILASVLDHSAFAYIKGPDAYSKSPVAAEACILDSSLQLALLALSKGLTQRLRLSVPTLIDELHFTPVSGMLVANSWVSDDGHDSGIDAISNNEVVLRIRGIHVRPLDNSEAELSNHAAAYLQWSSDFDSMEAHSLFPTQERTYENRLLEAMTLLCILESAKRLKDRSTTIWHFEKYGQWLQNQVADVAAGRYPLLEDSAAYYNLSTEQRAKAIDSLHDMISSIPSRAAVAIGLMRLLENIEGVYTGSTDPLELLLKDNILTEMYTMVSIDCGSFAKALSVKKPMLRILEVGAGTGGTTYRILEKLMDSGSTNPPYASYTFTDISAGFFPQAQDRFAYSPNFECKVFDISKDPFDQGFAPESYDFIVASNCIHATHSLNETLCNLRKVLAPDGHILLGELCTPSRIPGFLFGVFSGWWLGEEDDRADQPFVSLDRWDSELKAAGFSGVDLSVFDNEEPFYYSAAIVSQPKRNARMKPESITLLSKNPSQRVSNEVATHMRSLGFHVQIVFPGEPLPKDGYVISTLDLEAPVVFNMTKNRLQAIQRTIGKARLRDFLWLTPPSQIRCSNPTAAGSIGLLRSLRTELGVPLRILEIDTVEERFVDHIYNVLQKQFTSSAHGSLHPDMEFVVHEGTLKVGRYQPFDIQAELKDEKAAYDTSDMELHVERPGLLDTVHWKAKELALTILPENEVEIEVRAVGVNFRDIALSLGLIAFDTAELPLGLEVSGVVRRVGQSVTNVAKGDRVFAISHGGLFASLVNLPSPLVQRIPDEMSFEDAATLPLCFATVLRALVEIGQVEQGQSVLIHSACGGIGHAAIQLCQALGVKIYATVGTEEKATYLSSTFSIPRHRIFSSRNESFLADVMRETGNRGVDLVLNSLSGELLHASWKCVAEFGTMIELGKKDLMEFAKLDMQPFAENRSYCCVNLAPMMEKMPQKVERLLKTCLKMYQKGQISAIHPKQVFEAKDVQQAMRLLQTGNHIGKVIIRMPESTSEVEQMPLIRNMGFDPDSSYLLTGGLGGLGRTITRWMVQRGARHFVFMSRNGAKTEEQKEFLGELQALGCTVKVAIGSVQEAGDVSKALSMSERPLRGVIHLAMALRDIPFLDMSHQDWTQVFASKANGAWNLHNGLKGVPLDFFLLASSLIGSTLEVPGQSHYSAANTFLEALCRFRNELGLPASVLSICPIKDAGYVFENPAARKSIQAQALHFISQKEFLDFVELAILRSNQASRKDSKKPSHIIMGLKSDKPLNDPNNHIIWRHDRRMGYYHNLRKHVSNSAGTPSNPLQAFLVRAIESPEMFGEASTSELLAVEIGRKIIALTMKSDENAHPSMDLASMGLDSLMSIELRRWWKHTFGLDISVLEIMGLGTLEGLGRKLAKDLAEKHALAV